MEQFKFCLVLLALISLHRAAVVGQNFQNALQLIRPPINYRTFCSELYAGGDKIACRIAAELTVGLLVCKSAIVDGAPCDTVINNELQNLARLANAGVRTVAFYPYPITGLNCGEQPREVCSGMLEEWIGRSTGMFQHIRDAVAAGRVPSVIRAVREYTASGRLDRTAADLTTIYNYMMEERTRYRQICDLQGFFLRNGEFKVMDVPDILQNMGLNDGCWDGEPTTQQVLDALAAMITAFQTPPSPPGGGGGGYGGGGGQRQRQRQGGGGGGGGYGGGGGQRQRQRQGGGGGGGGYGGGEGQRQRQPQPQVQSQRQRQQPQPQAQSRQRQQPQPQTQSQRQRQQPQPQAQSRQRQRQQPQPQTQRRRRDKKQSITEAFWHIE